MKHRIVVLGAGYAGAYAAGTLARRLSPADTEITVVNAVPDFVQRLRLHRLAAGREIEAPKLTDVFAGTGIRLRVAFDVAARPSSPAACPSPTSARSSAATSAGCSPPTSPDPPTGCPGRPFLAAAVSVISWLCCVSGIRWVSDRPGS